MHGPHNRWATPTMQAHWHPDTRVMLEHEIWLSVLEVQYQIESDGERRDRLEKALDDYRRIADQYEEDRPIRGYRAAYNAAIAAREQETHHELKAHLEVFDQQAGGHGLIHLGMTSCDVTETTWQALASRATETLLFKAAAVLHQLSSFILAYNRTLVAARTHGVPAQPTTLGKRFADTAAALVDAHGKLRRLPHWQPLRGIAGAVGNHSDMLALGHDSSDTVVISDAVRCALRLPNADGIVSGQQYPRHLDHSYAAAICDLVAPVAAFANTLRVMTTLGQCWETPDPGQVGSSAMPHKRNPRYAERVTGLATVIRGYTAMLGEASSSQWFEGDVSNSSVRRVALPGVYLAADGLLNTAHYMLDRLAINEDALDMELRAWAPYLATGQFLARAVSRGVPREQGHEAIRQAAAAALDQSARGRGETLIHRLAGDEVLGLDQRELESIVRGVLDPDSYVYRAVAAQCEETYQSCRHVVEKYVGADVYKAQVL